MKTAISIPDKIFNSAENLAKRLGLSRSELYVRAISDYLETHSGQQVTETLNEIYAEPENQVFDEGFVQAQISSVDKDEWW